MPERSDGHVINPDVDTRGPADQCNIRPVVDDHRNGQRRNERATEVDERSSVRVLEPELDDRRAAPCRGARAGDEAVAAITQIVGDRDQREIDRRASLCSENVSLNS